MKYKPSISRLAAVPSTCSALMAVAVLASCFSASAETAWQTNGVPACSVAGSQESPYVVGLPSGGAIIVWADARALDYDIYAQKLDSDGNQVWTSGGVRICGATYDQQFPAAVADGAGGAIVVWQDGRLGDDGLALYAQRVLSDGAMAWQEDGVPVFSYVEGMEDPPMAFSQVVAGDGSGGAVVAWRDTRSDPVAGNTEIYAQRIDGAGAPLWAPNGVKILGFSGSKWSTRTPIIAPDGSGGAVVAWQDARTLATTANDLYIQRVNSTGTPMWTSNGVVVCNAAGEQGYPDIAGMAAGETVVVWEDKRSGNYDVYAQRFDASGAAQWGAGGLLICSSANDQRTPRVCGDGFGGLVVAWTDKRYSTAYTDVFAQRLDVSGAARWGYQGSAVCTAAGSQTRIRMGESVPGYTLFTWMDTRNETQVALYDVYGQMTDSAAALQWAPAGIPVGAITGSNQRLQQASADGIGGLCAVWEDDRNAGDWDVYAQKLTPWLAVSGIAQTRQLAPGMPLSIPARIVTGSFNDFFYIEEENRCAGIKVEYTGAFAPGSLLGVSGTLQLGPEPFIRALAVAPAGSKDVPGALGIAPSRLGSAAIGEVPGLSNVGLLIRSWGKITEFDTASPKTWFRIDDGSGVNVKCVVPDGVTIDPGWQWVAVTGISSCEEVGEEIHRLLRVRQQADITAY